MRGRKLLGVGDSIEEGKTESSSIHIEHLHSCLPRLNKEEMSDEKSRLEFYAENKLIFEFAKRFFIDCLGFLLRNWGKKNIN